MKSIFEENAYNEIKDRISKLESDSKAHWGKMNVGQMLSHCQIPLNVILEKNDYGLKPNWFAKTFFKSSMYNDKLWKKNMPTIKSFKVTDDKDFQKEKESLINLIEELYAERNRTNWQPHPTFGELTKDQWGKMQYKHLDHHFRQFGV